jgi:hypothetical protein
MLSFEIRQFIEEMKMKKAVGCILAPEKDLPALKSALEGAGISFADKNAPPSLRAIWIRGTQDLEWLPLPGILIASEELYSQNQALQEQVRTNADYFLNVTLHPTARARGPQVALSSPRGRGVG